MIRNCIGRIATGADANFLVVLGDPLESIDDATKLVGVVQNGRFMSLGRLLDGIDEESLSNYLTNWAETPVAVRRQGRLQLPLMVALSTS